MDLKKHLHSIIGLVSKPNYLNYKNVDLGNNNKHIFIACMPKSGSTFLSNTLAEITNFKKVPFRLRPIDNIYEHEVYLPVVYHSKNIDTITQQHARGSLTNYNILTNLSAYIFVQIRNIFDVVISTYDHSEITRKSGSTMAYGNEEYFNLSKDLKLKLIIDMIVPWHIHFYVSWFDRMKNNSYSKILWVSYEELISTENDLICSLLNFCEIKKTQKEIDNSILLIKESKIKARFNKGLSGRGDELSHELKNKIIGYTDYYPWVDFSKIGINK